LTPLVAFFRLLGVAHDPRSELRSVSVFSHLNAEKAPFYRAILRVFVEAKASFVLHLRPGDVRTVLRTRGELDESDA